MKKIFLKNKTISALFLITKRISRRFRNHNISEYSAYSVMFIILSFVPFFIILLNMLKALPIFDVTEGYEIKGTDEFTAYLRKLFNEIDSKTNGVIISVTTVVALWSASRGLIGIINGLNRIHSVKENRGFLKIRLYSILYTLLLMAVIIIVLVILIFGEAILKQAEIYLDISLFSKSAVFSMRWIIGFLLLVLFFTLIYSVLPIQKSKPLSKLTGALFCAAGWTGFSALYSVYVRHFSDYPSVYGSLSMPVPAVLWLYICIYILFIGEEINVMIESGYMKRHILDKLKALRYNLPKNKKERMRK